MNAKLLVRRRDVFPDGAVVQIVIWEVPRPVTASHHFYKYSLAYIVDGERVIGYDNERGKGDHRHERGYETPVVFKSLEQILRRFADDIVRLRRVK